MPVNRPPLVRPLALVAAVAVAVASLVVAPSPSFAQTAGAGSSTQIGEAVANLSSGDREKVVEGRQQLLGGLSGASRNPGFLQNYARDVSAALMPIVNGKDPHAKLNAAIVVQRLADQSGSTTLSDVIAKLIADPSPAVSAYGLRAASNVVPRVLADGTLVNGNRLVPAILQAVKAHPESEAIASEAYASLTKILLDRGAADLLTPTGVTQATPPTIDAVQKLLEIRLAEFGKGTLAEPSAEQPAIAFLGKQSTWAASSKAQQTNTIRLLLQLMNASATEMSTLPASGPGVRPKMEALRNLVRGAGGSLTVIAELAGKPELKTSAQQAQALGMATPAAEYKRVITLIEADFGRVMPEVRPATQATQATEPAQQ